MPEVVVALVETGAASGRSRAEVLRSVDADLGFDVTRVTMTRLYSHEQRPYMETRPVVEKLFKKAAEVGGLSDAEAIRRSVAKMAKYRKRKAGTTGAGGQH